MINQADVLVVGGGPVGCSLALALADAGLAVAVCEERAAAGRVDDGRTLALSHGAALILDRLGVWPALSASPIVAVDIAAAEGAGRAWLAAEPPRLPVLGHCLGYADLLGSLQGRLAGAGVRCYRGARVTALRPLRDYAVVDVEHAGERHLVTARLVVLADGGHGLAAACGIRSRGRDYGQQAITARLEPDAPPKGIAFERLTREGPLALLPLQAEHALIWSVPDRRVEGLCGLDEASFLGRVEEAMGPWGGPRLLAAGPRSRFPLVLRYASHVTAPRLALIGNAAQTLHPLAAQGLNVGLRDAWELAEEILGQARTHIGSDAMLARYRRRRRLDRLAGIAFTDLLLRSMEVLRGVAAHSLGLTLLDGSPAAKRLLLNGLIYGVRR